MSETAPSNLTISPFKGAPIALTPWYREQIWGGRSFESLLKRELPSAALYGESWEISTHPLHISHLSGGPFAGQLLTDVWSQHAEEISGGQFANGSPFPFLLKFLDCERPVSIQVHPSDEIAQRLLNEPNGKSEAWVVLDAKPDSIIYSGFREQVSKEIVSGAIEDGTLADLLHSFTPKAGDCISIPAGIAHSVGNGVLILEVQQLSDATFRMFDWQRLGPNGKPRQLHIDESFESIDWSAGAVKPTPPALVTHSENHSVELLLKTQHFEIARYQFVAETSLYQRNRMGVIALTKGAVDLSDSTGEHQQSLVIGDVVMLPANRNGWQVTPTSEESCELISIIPGNRQASG